MIIIELMEKISIHWISLLEYVAEGELIGTPIDTYNGQKIQLESSTLQWTTQFLTSMIILQILKFVSIKHYDESLMHLLCL